MNTAVHSSANTSADSCCHPEAKKAAEPSCHAAHVQSHDPHATHGAHGAHAHTDSWGAAASVTVHCLTGCAIGEFIGLAIGVGFGLPVAITLTLAVVLSFISGFALTLVPMLKRGFDLASAWRIVWLGEVISISVMELVMNLVDYHMGGMRAVSLVSAQYWQAFGAALVMGYLAAWPINKWMLARNMKNCH